MSIVAFKRSLFSRMVALATLASFLATFLPARTTRASNADGLAGIPIGSAGLSTVGNPPLAAGSAEALATVDLSTGAAKASYPFQLPTARGDAQPSLGLTYDSSNGVGFAGVGWTLNVPSIVRKGHAGIPRFQDPIAEIGTGSPFTEQTDLTSDDYYIDGALLIPIQVFPPFVPPGPAGIPGTPPRIASTPLYPGGLAPGLWVLFRAEVDDGARYFFDGVTWVKQTKSGHLIQFGQPLDGGSASVETADPQTAEAQAGFLLAEGIDGYHNAIYRWNLVRDADASGNAVYYVWDDEHQLFGVAAGSNQGSVATAGTQFLTDIYDTANTPNPPPPVSNLVVGQLLQPTATCAPTCPDFGACSNNWDCASFVCASGVCQPPSCSPICNQGAPCGSANDCGSLVCGGILAGGGTCLPPACSPSCADGNACNNNGDCASFACSGGVCQPPSCSPACNQGAPCGSSADCGSSVCTSGACTAAAPDGGSATGPSCAPTCPDGAACSNNNQCASFVCSGGTCQPPSCAPGCNQGAPCGANTDCGSLTCTAGTCAPPSCSPSCANGSACNNNGDCESFTCTGNACAPPGCAPKCGQAQPCGANGDCTSSACVGGKCAAPTGMLDELLGLVEKEAHAQQPATTFAHHVHLTWSLPSYPGYTTDLAPPGSTAPNGYGLGKLVAPYAYSPIWKALPFAQLTTVDVFSATTGSVDRQLVREYQLTYTYNSTQTRSFLATVQLVGDCDSVGGISEAGLTAASVAACASGENMPPTTFTYYGVPLSVGPPSPGIGPPPEIVGTTSRYSVLPAVGGLVDLTGDAVAEYFDEPFNGPSCPYEPNASEDTLFFEPFVGAPSPCPDNIVVPTLSNYSIVADWTTVGQNSVLELTPSNVLSQCGGNLSSVYLWQLGQFGHELSYGGNDTEQDTCTNTVVNQSGSLAPADVARLQVDLGYNGGPPPGVAGDGFISSRAFDVDGDGLPEMTLVPATTAGTHVYNTYFTSRDRNGQVHPFATTGIPYVPSPAIDPTVPPFAASTKESTAIRAVADIDGDGLGDVVLANKYDAQFNIGSNGPPTYVGLQVLPSRGDGRFGVPDNIRGEPWQGYGNAIVPGVDGINPAPPSDSMRPELMQNSQIAFGDVTGDGFADFAILDQDGTHLCVRYGGWWDTAHWRCVQLPVNAVFNNIVPNDSAVMIGDLDGSGINQVVVITPGALTATAYRISPGGQSTGVPDGLLQAAYNGRGAQTSFSYDSVHHLAATGALPVGTQLPVPRWVVTSSITTNNLAGTQAVSIEKDYSYGAPIYDARDRLFVGFQAVREHTLGDGTGNNLGTFVTTTFATTADYQCATGCLPEALVRASRGLPEVVEVDEEGQDVSKISLRSTLVRRQLSSTVYAYDFQSPYAGLDGRAGLSIAQRGQTTYHWDASLKSQTASVGGATFLGVALPQITASLPASSPAIVMTSSFDPNGNEISTVDAGRVGTTDQAILVQRVWSLPSGDTSGWRFRVMQEKVGYEDGTRGDFDTTQSIREMDYLYDSLGRVTEVVAPLTGGVALPGPAGQSRAAGQPPTAILNAAELVLRVVKYDPVFGNVTQVGDLDNPCLLGIAYDPIFAQLPISETISPQGCGAPGLASSLAIDRRLGLVTSTLNAASQLTIVRYDDFGRVVEMDEPNELQATVTTAVLYADYKDSEFVSMVHVRTGSGLAGSAAAPSFTDHYRYVDGLGETRAVVDAIDPASHPGQAWVISGIHTTAANGRVTTVYRPQYASGPAPIGLLPAEVTSPTGASASFAYDGLGRTVQRTDFRGNASSMTYRDAALSVDILDAEQLAGAHQGSSTTITRDGHGRAVFGIQHLAAGPQNVAGEISTTVTYQATGEPITVTQSTPTGLVTRNMTYDSLGRLITNTEPNVGTWTYAHDGEGRVVGTSDARGCGKNIFYDLAGRVLAVDYSPCLPSPAQAPYTPVTVVGASFPYPGAEESYAYQFDGLLANVSDRAHEDSYSYTGGGFLSEIDRKMALPSTGSGAAVTYGATHSKFLTQYDVSGRVTQWQLENVTLPTALAGSANGPGSAPIYVSETTTLDMNGNVAQIASTTSGTILQGQSFNADGSVQSQTFGDAAATRTVFGYDANGSRTSYSLARSDGPWVSGVAGYSPPVDGDAALIGNLTDLTLTLDKVGNPTAIVDGSTASWPSGAMPVSQTYAYWDDYRLNAVTTTSAPDAYVNPYQVEQSTGSGLYPQPATPSTGTRPRSQSFQYDWRGNVTTSSDDAADSFDRSLGNVTIAKASDRLVQATASSGALLTPQYDEAGNITKIDMSAPSGAQSSEYTFLWDELGQLASASRDDGTGQVTESYVYPAGGPRMLTAKTVNGGDPSYTVAIFDVMLLKDASVSGGDYVDDTSTEQIYLAGGMARVFDDVAPGGVPGTMPQASTSTTNAASVHTFLSFGDSRASGAFVVDKDSGELVEHATYLAYGALESDQRAPRWESSREDLKLAGQWDNAEVGLDYFNARYYSPQLGRFISPDPLTIHALGGDANPYEYAYGSPLRYIDPTGLGPECDPESGGCSSDPGPGGDDGNDPVVVSGSSGGGTGTSGSGGGGGGQNMGGGGPNAGDRRVQAEFQSFKAEAAVQPFALTPPTFENVGRAAYSGLRQGLSQAALLGSGALTTYNWARDVWAATDPNASGGSALFHGGLAIGAFVPFLDEGELGLNIVREGMVGVELGGGGGSIIAEGAGAAEAAGSEMTTLYRGVMPAELKDIQTTGQFINRGSAEGKYFSLDAKGVSSYAKQAVKGFGDPAYTLVRTQIPTSLLTPQMGATVDRGVSAVVIPDALLPSMTPTVMPFMAVPF